MIGRRYVVLAAVLVAAGCKDGEDTDVPELCAGDSGTVCIVAGTGSAGSREGEPDPLANPLYGPMDVELRDGTSDFFIGDWNNHKIRFVEGGEMRTVVGTDFLGDGDPDFQERVPPGVPGTTVALNHPTQLEWNPVTNKLLLPSWHNHRVRQWDPVTGNSLVVCADTEIDDGNGANAGFAGDGGPAADALMAFPNSIAVDPLDGSFWLLPSNNNRVRWVAADFSLIDTVAGNGTRGYEGDGGDALEAAFYFWAADDLQPEPSGSLAFDPSERKLYVADTSNHVIRVFDVTTGTIETLPGTGVQGLPGGDCDPAALCFPRDIELLDRTLYIADTDNDLVRAYDLDTGTMTTVAGTGERGAGEDGLPPLETKLNRPFGIDVGADGAIYIADTYNHVIRKVIP
ncbi:MAG: hypothetical protein H6737_06005 [Alphaproteobacteria bacterium]|nr:hypothetical protein [Alphaproteobacteria bacterium]